MITSSNPKVVTICGSSKFCDIMAVCAWLIERDEKAITLGLHFLPFWYPTNAEHHLAEAEGVAQGFNELHLRKIDMSDEIFVCNVNDYIGEDTQREIKYTMSLGKPIRWFTHDPIGEQVRTMIDNFIALRKEAEGKFHGGAKGDSLPAFGD